MKDITIHDLTDLVVAEVPEADSRLEKMFDWHFQRDVMITKWVLGTAASLAVSVLIAYFKAEFTPSWWQICLMAGIPLITSSYGFYRLFRIRLIQKQFVSALKISNRLKSIRPFIIKYNETSGQ